MIKGLRERLRSTPDLLLYVGLAVPAYLSLLLSSPGRVAGDTKLYLYLDPRRLIADSLWTWDTRQFGGWVPHQNVGYLWPTGPFYALFDALRIPDWVAQRLWLGTIMTVAGIGCLWFGRRLGSSTTAAFLAATVYEFSPFVLPYISRTSALLLPWALLPWLCGVAMIASRRWLAVAAFGFLVLSSGGLNATALLMIAPGPAIWIIHQWRSGRLSTGRTLRTMFLLGAVSLLVSAWWLSGLFVQGRYGAAVLSYSESLVSTAATSSAPEVLRGLGYWLFYDRNDVVALTSASAAHQESLVVLAAGGLLVVLGLWGILGDRKWRWPLMTMVLVGTVLAVGPHPFNDPSPIWSLAVEHPKSALSMALRSSTRAVPLIVLAIALGIGTLIDRVRSSTGSGTTVRSRLVVVFVALLVVLDAPAVVSGDLIDPSLTRPERLPQAWYDTATFLDDRFDEGYTGSVLLVPGIESAAYRWGYPVDPILPGLTKKPFLSRDWLPLGSAPMMDLLYALDDAFQSGTAGAASVAPIARLLGADTVMVVTSHQYERFGTIRPETADALLGADPPGLRLLKTFGSMKENIAVVDGVVRWSEDLVAHPPQEQPEIRLYGVEQATSPARISEHPLLVAADGSGLVDLGALGILDGTDIVLTEAALDDDDLRLAIAAAPEVMVTDSNRRRAHQWRSSQDVWGATEPRSGVLLDEDLFDSRLPVFPGATESSETIVDDPSADTGAMVRASSYGPLLSYWPEYRPKMAVDGDPDTSWRVGVDANPVGQRIVVEARDQPFDRLRLLQPLDSSERWITMIDYRLDDGPWTSLALDSSSRTEPGQNLVLPSPAGSVTLRVSAISSVDPYDQKSGPGVGFAEILPADRTSPEVLRVPTRLDQFVDDSTPVSFAFTRWRSDPLVRWRQDPETSLRRSFSTNHPDTFEPAVTVRLAPRSSEPQLVTALGLQESTPAWSRLDSIGRLTGSPIWWAAATIDGDPDSVWWSQPFNDPDRPNESGLSLPLDSSISGLTLHQVSSDLASTITRVRLDVSTGGRVTDSVELDVPSPDAEGISRLEFPTVSGDRLDVMVTKIDPRLVHDQVTGRLVAAPVGIAEISASGPTSTGLAPLPRPSRYSSGCRDDLLFLDGAPVSIRFEGTVSDALAGRPLTASPCDATPLTLSAGDHLLQTARGSETGWDVDAVVLRSSSRQVPESATPADLTTSRGRRSVAIPTCTTPCWIEMPDGWNVGWRSDDSTLGTPLASGAGRTTWVLDDRQAPRPLSVTWSPQRFVWWGLMITAVTMLLLLSVAIADRSGRLHRHDEGRSRRPPSRLPVVPLTALMLGSSLIDPVWGVALCVLGLVLAGRPRVLAVVGWMLVGLSMTFLVAQQVRTGAAPGFDWPSVFGRAHRPALAGVTILWCAVLALDRRPSDPR